jgi:hypothetical protein
MTVVRRLLVARCHPFLLTWQRDDDDGGAGAAAIPQGTTQGTEAWTSATAVPNGEPEDVFVVFLFF